MLFKKFSVVLLISILVSGCSTTQESTTIAITNVTTIDPSSYIGFESDRTVIIEDNRITKVGSAKSMPVPSEAKVIDGTGKYLMPGLWDAHVHFTYEPEMSNSMFDLFLVNGITSVRDTGGELELVIPFKRASETNPKTAPRVMVAGPLLDGVPTVYDGVSRIKLGEGAANPEQGIRLVDKYVNGGVDFIKSYEMLTPETFKAVLSRAKEQGKLVTGHVPLSMDVIEASNLGLNSMEHMRNLEMAISRDKDSLLAVRQNMLKNTEGLLGLQLRSAIHSAQRIHAVQTQDELRRDLVLEALKMNGTWQIPTLSIITPRAFQPFSNQEWRDNYKYLPQSVEERWTDGSLETLKNIPTSQDSIYPMWALHMVSEINKAEIPLMAGTDTPIFFLTPGFSLHNELALLVQAGLSPIEAIKAATITPAQYFDMGLELGLVKEGYLADLVLLGANPMEDIGNTTTIEAVVKDGNVFTSKELAEILEKLDQGK